MSKLAPLEESLLKGDSSVSNNSNPKKTRENGNLTSYSKAGFFSILTFSWISPLITLGNKKIIEHEDLPLLSNRDSAYGTFPTFRNKLESECGSASRVTTLKLAKVLILSTWQGILSSGLFAFLFTCASYVGPYLIENLVQYLNEENKSKNQGYVLVMVFVAAKLVECLSQRQWMFRFQQVGVRMQSMLVAMIYAKGLTLSSQSKEGHSSGEMSHMPVYFVPDSMSIWDLLREFRVKKVHMAVICNEYGGTVGIVTLEDIVEEFVGEIFDENDSKEEIQKKTGNIVMLDEGVFDVDANTSIDQLSEDLNIKMPEDHQYETVSGFVCENFGYIPKIGEIIEVALERKNEDDNDVPNANHQDQKETFKLEILAGNARKVTTVQFTRTNGGHEMLENKEVTRKPPKLMKRKWSRR